MLGGHLIGPDVTELLPELTLARAAELTPDEIGERLARWTPPAARYTTGVLAKYRKLVGSAATGAVCG